MRINRFVALAAIALIVVAAIGTIAARASAQASGSHPRQVQATEAPDSQEAAEGQDNDNIAEQAGEQNEADGAEANDGRGAAADEGSDNVTSETPAITAEAAQKTAEEYLNAGAATAVELDNENGKLVYGVEINGTDVKVDAMTGEVLGVETGQD